jgi:hypothetical protein
VENGIPQGAALIPILFNIMMSDFPTHRSKTSSLLFAEDIMIVTKAKKKQGGRIITTTSHGRCQPLGQEMEIYFRPHKSGTITFTRSYRPGEEPLLFPNGHKINPIKSTKFLRVKNLLKILPNTKAGPPTQTLILLFKS